MKFAHLADCHIGGWRDPKMKELPLLAFVKAIDKCIEKEMDFVLIAGDLFNTSHPAIDDLKTVVSKLKELKDNNISTYMIAGSHDFSATGKTMLDVLEEAGLIINVTRGEVADSKLKLKFTTDIKTGAKITGMLGKKGMLEKKFYDTLDRKSIEDEDGFKIFMFHTSITELKPKSLEKMDSNPVSLLPRGFDYYAGGHIHIIEKRDFEQHKNVVYPGPIFPNNFRELEQLKSGGFYIYHDEKISYEKISLYNVENFSFNADNKTPEALTREIIDKVSNKEFVSTIILIRAYGTLKSGKISDIDFRKIIDLLYDKGAYFVMRNTAKLSTKEFEEINIVEDSIDMIEQKVIDEHASQNKLFENEKDMIKNLMKALSESRGEDEKVMDYKRRIKNELNKILGVE